MTQLPSVDFLALVGTDTRLRWKAQTGGGEYAGACPFGCGVDHDGFLVHPSEQRWYCRGCSENAWRDPASYLMRRDGIGFTAALALLQALTTGDSLPETIRRPLGPDADWMARAAAARDDAAAMLAATPHALTYLEKRGVRSDTAARRLSRSG